MRAPRKPMRRSGPIAGRLRFVDAADGVPNETRQFLPGGFTTFERILPGPDRMYPDTDSPPTRVERERVERLRAELPPAPWEREARYGAWGVPLETTHYLIRRGGAAVVDEVIRQTGVDGRTAAVEIGQRARALGRAGVPIERLGAEGWMKVFHLYTDARLPRELIPAVATRLADQPGLSGEEAARAAGFDPLPPGDWQAQAQAALDLSDWVTYPGETTDRRTRWLTGRAVARLRGRAAAAEVAAFVRSRLGGEA